MDDALTVGGIKRVGDLNRYIEELVVGKRTGQQTSGERFAFEQFHGDKWPAFVLSDFINGANVLVIDG